MSTTRGASVPERNLRNRPIVLSAAEADERRTYRCAHSTSADSRHGPEASWITAAANDTMSHRPLGSRVAQDMTWGAPHRTLAVLKSSRTPKAPKQ